jgi:hypothetical protein
MPEPTYDSAWAVRENAAMQQGEQPLVVSGMNHAIHLEVHLQDAAEQMAPLQEAMEEGGIDPAALEKAYQYIGILGPHAEDHLAQLEQDPSAENLVQLFRTQLKNVAAFHGKLRGAILDARRMAQQQALEQQNATALSIKDQAELQSMQADIQREDAKAAADVRRKDWKAQEAQRLKTWQAGQKNQLDTAKAIGDQRIKRISAAPTKQS